MLVTNIVDEDFVNYKKPSMFIGTAYCDWKCCVEGGFSPSTCQNHKLANTNRIDIEASKIVDRYLCNPISEAIVFGGLEPMLQINDVDAVLAALRQLGCDDDVVVYTGYMPHEVDAELSLLKRHPNVIVKFGRYMPNLQQRFDAVLGVELASENQYGERIS